MTAAVRSTSEQYGTLFASAQQEVLLAARIVAADGGRDDAALLIVAATAREADLGLALPAA
jgi:hypothetical protein